MPERLALWFMFFAYSAVFLILFLFVVRLSREARVLGEELARLRRELEEMGERQE